LTATVASSRGTVVATTTPALTIPLVQATPITVSQIHQEERVVQLEQRNAELQAALGQQREQQQEEALAPGCGIPCRGLLVETVEAAKVLSIVRYLHVRVAYHYCGRTGRPEKETALAFATSDVITALYSRPFGGFGKSHHLANLDRDSGQQ
jgi:hypothetical protein